ncbi:unnamed protein product [Rhizoctonia solani]|uniref:Uncharacterized protein n=1 Tax=Rhizoctonia solani TaxID=456999 RepID=A0A8H3HQ06_9AGAM|nr:unnamed protein product [Rhizoctonia solani]
MDSYPDLELDSLDRGANPKELASGIGSVFSLSNQPENGTTLARTQNGSGCLPAKLPKEALSAIFANIVFDRDSDGSNLLSMEQEVRLIYCRIYGLAGVCLTWRKILMTEGVFWSVIPMIARPSTANQAPFRLCLQQAERYKLHLAAAIALSNPHGDLVDVLTKHGPRFHAINLSAGKRKVIRDAISALLQHNASVSLSKLSIQFINTSDMDEMLPRNSDYLFPRKSPHCYSFTRLVETLSAFHIRGMPIHNIAFSSRLVELQIGDINLGYDKKVIPFLQALSSASELRDLKLMSVSTLHRPDITPDMVGAFPAVAFPKLQSLHLQDLYFNTLEFLLPMIAPGSYSTTLFLTPKTVWVNILEEDEFAHEFVHDCEINRVAWLCDVLKITPVDTLMMSGYPDGSWFSEELLHHLLNALPGLKTLKIDNWVFRGPVWNDLKQSQNTRRILPSQFPALERLILTSTTIRNMDGFQEMLAIHPLQQVVLGVTVETVRPGGTHQTESLNEGSNIVAWLMKNVPDFRLVDSHYSPSEFRFGMWQLW